MCGYGLLICNDGYWDNWVVDYVCYDLLVLVFFIYEQCGQLVYWIGYFFGGVVLVVGLGGGYLDQVWIVFVVLFGSQVSIVYWLFRLFMVGIFVCLLLCCVDVLFGSCWWQGLEDELVGLVLEVLCWYGLFGCFGELGNDWWKGFVVVDVLLLVVVGVGDWQDLFWVCCKLFEQFVLFECEYLLFGCEVGYVEDYGYIEMLIGKVVQLEVWFLVECWLCQ